jgi:hypothetical protein
MRGRVQIVHRAQFVHPKAGRFAPQIAGTPLAVCAAMDHRDHLALLLAPLAVAAALSTAACADVDFHEPCGSQSECNNDKPPCTGSECEAPPDCEPGDCECADECPPPAPTGDSTYYVGGPNASDSNPGTAEAPFATIQRAANVAVGGESVGIRSGVYRETVVPANSGSDGEPIVFQPDGEATVVVSGADVVDGQWSVHQGDIYRVDLGLASQGYNDSMTDNTTLLANQVFVDGKMMIEARWPNLPNSDDLLNRNDMRASSQGDWTGGSVDDDGIPNIEGGWAGGQLWTIGWFIPSSHTITGHAGTHVEFSGNLDPAFSYQYYLTGRLGALDAEKEWFYDGTSLYLWAPGGGSPAGVEVKRRNYAFDLNDKSFITVRGLEIFAASIISNENSLSIELDSLAAKYINHSVTVPGGDLTYSHTDETGIRLLGPGSVIENSVVEVSSDHGIVLGENTIARNNLVHDISYNGTYNSGIAPVNGKNGQKILHNTIYRTGRSVIDLRNSQNMEIGYNHLYEFGMLNIDLGAIYGARNVFTGGTRIHHNWIHDSRAPIDVMGIQTGIYFDQAAGPCTVDHNVLWNNGNADIYNQLENGDMTNGASLIYNNTMATTGGNTAHSYVTYTNSPVDLQRNNIYRNDIVLNWGDSAGDVASSLFEGTDPQFVNAGEGGLMYRLAAGSPAIDAGIQVEGITDGFSGSAPDFGAYELGGEEWVAGYTAP